MRSPWRRRIAAVIRTVDDLPLVPTTWTAPKRSCGEPSAVSSRRMRSRPNRMPNSSSDSSRRSASAQLARSTTAPPARPSAAPASRARRRPRPPGAPWRRSPALLSLPSARLISAAQRLARGLELGGGLGRVDALQQLDLARRHGDDGDGLGGVVGSDRREAREAGDQRDEAVEAEPSTRAARNAPGLTPPASRQERTAWTVAMTRSTSRSASRVAGGAAYRARARARRAGRSPPGTCSHSSSVTNGMIGCASDERLAQHVQTASALRSSSNSRPLISSRYQSHSSP